MLGASNHAPRATPSAERETLGASLEGHGSHQPDDADHMVGVKMSEEDIRYSERDVVPHHLPLRAFSTIEEQRLAFTHDGEGGGVPFHSGTRCRGSEEAY